MKLDLYIKIIFTIIAGCLVWICVKDINFGNPVHAQQIQRVVIVGFDGGQFSEGAGLPVYLKNSSREPLEVQIKGIGRGKSYVSPFNLLPWQPLPLTSVSPIPSPIPSLTPSPASK